MLSETMSCHVAWRNAIAVVTSKLTKPHIESGYSGIPRNSRGLYVMSFSTSSIASDREPSVFSALSTIALVFSSPSSPSVSFRSLMIAWVCIGFWMSFGWVLIKSSSLATLLYVSLMLSSRLTYQNISSLRYALGNRTLRHRTEVSIVYRVKITHCWMLKILERMKPPNTPKNTTIEIISYRR